MKPKTLTTLIIIFVILSATYGIILFLNRPQPTKIEPSRIGLPLEKIEKANKITIKKANEVITLKKENETWKVNQFKADNEIVKNFLSNLNALTIDSLTSRNEKNYPMMEVNEEKGSLVTFFQGKNIISSFFVGKEGASFQDFYLRISGKKEVYLAKGEIKFFIEKTVDDWRDKKILSVQENQLKSLTYTYSTSTFSLIKKANDWFAQSDSQEKKVKKDTLQPLLDELKSLNALGFANKKEENLLEQPDSTLSLSFNYNLKPETLVFKKKDESTYLVKRLPDPTIYTITISTYNIIMKRFEEF